MAGNQDGDVPAQQDVSSSDDARVAGHGPDVHRGQVYVSRSQGVQVGDHTMQVNYYIGENEIAARRFNTEDSLLTGTVPPGRPVREARNPFDYDVHESIRPHKAALPVPGLPTYVPRGHDADLEKVTRRALAVVR